MCSVCFCFRKPPLSMRSYFKTRPDVSLEMAPIGDDRYSAFSKWSPSNALILSWMRAGLLYNPLYSPTPTPATQSEGENVYPLKVHSMEAAMSMKKELSTCCWHKSAACVFSQTIRISIYTWLDKLFVKDKNHTGAVTIIYKSVCAIRKTCLWLCAYLLL